MKPLAQKPAAGIPGHAATVRGAWIGLELG